jgi:TonB family protein
LIIFTKGAILFHSQPNLQIHPDVYQTYKTKMKQYLLMTIFLLGLTSFSLAQKNTDGLPETLKTRVNSTQAEFPGGPEKMKKYFEKNTRYAREADKNNHMGIVYVTFIVEKDGSLDSVKLLQTLTEYYDQEALRLVKKMPKWKPAMQNGLPVRTQFNFPVKF